MLFSTIFSVLALAAFGASAPAPASVDLEERSPKPKSKFYCTTKYSGTLTGPGLGGGKSFPFTKTGSLVTYTGSHPKSGVLHVEYQACSNATTGHIEKDGTDFVGRLRLKGTSSCIDLSSKTSAGIWLPKIAACNSKKLTPGQTWRYDTAQFGLFWGGYFYYGNTSSDDGEVCRAGYIHDDQGIPVVTKKKQIQVTCAGEDLSRVQFWKLK